MAPTDPRILAIHRASCDFAENWSGEDSIRAHARAKAAEVGCVAITPGAGSILRLLASSIDAKSIVEIGTGGGVSTLWFLEGMNDEGVLTSIDHEPEHQIIARDALAQADIEPNRVRLINGKPNEVLERMTPKAYDIVFISGRPADLEENLGHAFGLLRSGGLLIVDRALWNDRVPDPAQRDADTVAMRTALESLKSHDGLTSSVLSVGGGLFVATVK